MPRKPLRRGTRSGLAEPTPTGIRHLTPWFRPTEQPLRGTSDRPLAIDGSSTLGFGTVRTWFDIFSLPAIPAVLDSRQLIVEVVADSGKTAIRVDSQVTWLPARPAGEKVPPAVRAVTVSEYLGWNVDSQPPRPVTITDPAKVRALVALIDGLPMPPQFGAIAESCPDSNGSDLTLAFSARPGAPRSRSPPWNCPAARAWT